MLTVVYSPSQVVDVSKKGWTDLSGIFGKSVSLYEDPNESASRSSSNGNINSGHAYYDYSGAASGYQDFDAVAAAAAATTTSAAMTSSAASSSCSSDQADTSRETVSKSPRSGNKSSQKQESRRKEDSNGSSRGDSAKERRSEESSSLIAGSSSPSSVTKQAKQPKEPVRMTTGVSREERMLLDLESDLKPDKGKGSKAKPKTLEDDFWADLEK